MILDALFYVVSSSYRKTSTTVLRNSLDARWLGTKSQLGLFGEVFKTDFYPTKM